MMAVLLTPNEVLALIAVIDKVTPEQASAALTAPQFAHWQTARLQVNECASQLRVDL